jgi:hypothetical protein
MSSLQSFLLLAPEIVLVAAALVAFAIFAALMVAMAYLFKVVPGGLVPDEDQGYMFAVLQLPALGPPQYMGPPNFPPPGMTTVHVVGNPLLAVGPPNYIDFSSG